MAAEDATADSGKVCRKIFGDYLKWDVKERELVFGAEVLLVGISGARDLLAADSNGLSDPYCTVVPLDAKGKEISVEKRKTRVIMKTLSPSWDEVFIIGQKSDASQMSKLLIKVKDWDAVGSDDDLGELVLDMNEFFGSDPHRHVCEWMPLVARKKMSKSKQKGEVHIQMVYHEPPPDPVPEQIVVEVLEARGLAAAGEKTYVTCAPLNKAGAEIEGAKAYTDTALVRGDTVKWEEAVPLPTAAVRSVKSILFKIKNKKTLGSDASLGEARVSLAGLFMEDSEVDGRHMIFNHWYDIHGRTRQKKRKDSSETGSPRVGQLRLKMTLTFAFEIPTDDEAEEHARKHYSEDIGKSTRIILSAVAEEEEEDAPSPEPEPVQWITSLAPDEARTDAAAPPAMPAAAPKPPAEAEVPAGGGTSSTGAGDARATETVAPLKAAAVAPDTDHHTASETSEPVHIVDEKQVTVSAEANVGASVAGDAGRDDSESPPTEEPVVASGGDGADSATAVADEVPAPDAAATDTTGTDTAVSSAGADAAKSEPAGEDDESSGDKAAETAAPLPEPATPVTSEASGDAAVSDVDASAEVAAGGAGGSSAAAATAEGKESSDEDVASEAEDAVADLPLSPKCEPSDTISGDLLVDRDPAAEADMTDEERQAIFYEKLRAQAEEREAAAQRAEAEKLAIMDDEERAEYERKKTLEKKRQARKSIMTNRQMAGYGAGAARRASMATRGRGRGRGRGRRSTITPRR